MKICRCKQISEAALEPAGHCHSRVYELTVQCDSVSSTALSQSPDVRSKKKSRVLCGGRWEAQSARACVSQVCETRSVRLKNEYNLGTFSWNGTHLLIGDLLIWMKRWMNSSSFLVISTVTSNIKLALISPSNQQSSSNFSLLAKGTLQSPIVWAEKFPCYLCGTLENWLIYENQAGLSYDLQWSLDYY